MKKKTTIGIDIDGTLTVPDFWVEPLNKHFNKDYKYGQTDVYDWREIYNVDDNIFMQYYTEHGPTMHYNANIRPDVSRIINKWYTEFDLYYITARQKFLTDTTEKWLNKHELPGKYFVLGSHYKLNKAKELNCEIFIEDNYDVACQLAEGGIKVVLLDCVYNRKQINTDRITRVYNWNEVAEQVHYYTTRNLIS